MKKLISLGSYGTVLMVEYFNILFFKKIRRNRFCEAKLRWNNIDLSPHKHSQWCNKLIYQNLLKSTQNPFETHQTEREKKVIFKRKPATIKKKLSKMMCTFFGEYFFPCKSHECDFRCTHRSAPNWLQNVASYCTYVLIVHQSLNFWFAETLVWRRRSSASNAPPGSLPVWPSKMWHFDYYFLFR